MGSKRKLASNGMIRLQVSGTSFCSSKLSLSLECYIWSSRSPQAKTGSSISLISGIQLINLYLVALTCLAPYNVKDSNAIIEMKERNECCTVIAYIPTAGQHHAILIINIKPYGASNVHSKQ